jgi:hypothetical protein
MSLLQKCRPTALVGFLLLAGSPLASGCVTEPEDRDLRVVLTVEEEPVVLGDSAIFRMEAEGRALLGFRLEFGDGREEADETHLAVMIQRRIAHLYEEDGDFEAVATVEEADGRTTSDRVTVTVTPGSDG